MKAIGRNESYSPEARSNEDTCLFVTRGSRNTGRELCTKHITSLLTFVKMEGRGSGRGRGRKGRGRGRGSSKATTDVMKDEENIDDTSLDMEIVEQVTADNESKTALLDPVAPIVSPENLPEKSSADSIVDRLSCVQERVKLLLKTQSLLEDTLHDLKRRHPHLHKSINYLDVIQLGNRISTTLHSPRHWKPGAPLVAGYPPAPQADHMRKGILGNVKLNISTPNYGDILKQIQEEIQLTAKLSLQKRPLPAPLVSAPPPAQSIQEKKRAPETLPPPEQPIKKHRAININFGFESGSDSD